MFPGFDFEFESDEENLNDLNRFRLVLRSHLLFIRSTQRDVANIMWEQMIFQVQLGEQNNLLFLIAVTTQITVTSDQASYKLLDSSVPRLNIDVTFPFAPTVQPPYREYDDHTDDQYECSQP